jgi:hypothetical protein
MLDINDAIILSCAPQGGAMATAATEQTGLTRVAVLRRIKKLADAGYLQRHGTGTRQTYSLGNKRFWLRVEPLADIVQRGGEMVSRSQAKWVMNRATQFKTVILEFEGVVHVGQAFFDEVFRVFATAHPHIRLKTLGMSPEVAKLVGLFGG